MPTTIRVRDAPACDAHAMGVQNRQRRRQKQAQQARERRRRRSAGVGDERRTGDQGTWSDGSGPPSIERLIAAAVEAVHHRRADAGKLLGLLADGAAGDGLAGDGLGGEGLAAAGMPGEADGAPARRAATMEATGTVAGEAGGSTGTPSASGT